MKPSSDLCERRARGVFTSTRALTEEQRLRIWSGKSLRLKKMPQEDKNESKEEK